MSADVRSPLVIVTLVEPAVVATVYATTWLIRADVVPVTRFVEAESQTGIAGDCLTMYLVFVESLPKVR